MPKAKTKKSVSSRMKVTKGGKVLRHRQGSSHMMVRMDRKRKRNLRKACLVLPSRVARTMKRLMGEG